MYYRIFALWLNSEEPTCQWGEPTKFNLWIFFLSYLGSAIGCAWIWTGWAVVCGAGCCICWTCCCWICWTGCCWTGWAAGWGWAWTGCWRTSCIDNCACCGWKKKCFCCGEKIKFPKREERDTAQPMRSELSQRTNKKLSKNWRLSHMSHWIYHT